MKAVRELRVACADLLRSIADRLNPPHRSLTEDEAERIRRTGEMPYGATDVFIPRNQRAKS